MKKKLFIPLLFIFLFVFACSESTNVFEPEVSSTKIAIKNSLTLSFTLLMHEIIHIGVIKVVKTINKIEIPSTPNLNLIKLFIQDLSSTN